MNLISLSFTKVLVPKPGADQFFPNDHQKRTLPEKYPHLLVPVITLNVHFVLPV